MTDPVSAWQVQEVAWYGEQTQTMDVMSAPALWHRDGEVPLPLRWVLLRDPTGKRDPLALFCTDPAAAPLQIIAWYVSRWQIEVTFEESRAHLGVETQRQWSTLAITRTTPCLLGLFSVATLVAHARYPTDLPARQAAWYRKVEPTFADVLAAIRRDLWTSWNPPSRMAVSHWANSPAHPFDALLDAACYAA